MNHNYPENILEVLRERNELEEDDTSMDEYFQTISPDEVFDEILEWEGIIGYTHKILSWIQDIYKVRLNNQLHEQSRQEFVQGLGTIFSAQDHMGDVTGMRMDENDQVTVHFRGGFTHHANCIMDSKIAIISDILKQAL